MLETGKKHKTFGFHCLHYSVSESSGYLLVKVLNKSNDNCSVGVRTVDGEAIAGDDYDGVDTVLNFQKKGEQTVKIGIKDDENWEPDEDFYVELYDPETKNKLEGEDCRTRVTIIDDDRPGVLQFEC